MTLNSTVLAWVTLPGTEAYYAAGSCGIGRNGALGVFPQTSQGMVRDALELADGLVNFADFDTDNDGYVDAIDIIHSGMGRRRRRGIIRTGSGRIAGPCFKRPAGIGTSGDVNGAGVNVKVYDYHTEAALWGAAGRRWCGLE